MEQIIDKLNFEFKKLDFEINSKMAILKEANEHDIGEKDDRMILYNDVMSLEQKKTDLNQAILLITKHYKV